MSSTVNQEFYLATYTTKGGSGIGRGRIEPADGRPRVVSWTIGVPNPSWLDAGQSTSTLYAISELSPDGLINALRILDGGGLVLLNHHPAGDKPAHLVVHPSGRFLITSMFDGGNIAVHRIADDGSVAELCDTRELSAPGAVSHAHQVVVDPSGAYLLAVDLGLDAVVTFRLDPASGRLTERGRTHLRPGSGPRHLAFHPKGEHAYLVNELDSTVTACHWADGVLTAIDVQPTLLPAVPGGILTERAAGQPNYPGELVITADGRFLYLTNRGDNSIAVFAVRDEGARLELLFTHSCGGDWPRHLAIDATGNWLYVANERSGDVTWFPRDRSSGRLGDPEGRLLVPGVAQLYLVAG